jgi:hypothetical protein
MQAEPEISTPTAIHHTFAERGRIYIDRLKTRNRRPSEGA